METNRLLELLLAAHVRDLAVGLRRAELPIDIAEDAAAQWYADHPAEQYVPAALAKIEAAWKVIAKQPSATPAAP